MMNEIRNELIYIDLIMNKPEAEKSNYYSLLIERFYYDIKDQLSDLEYKKKQLESNMELLKHIIKENDQLIKDRTLKNIIEKD